MALTDKLTAIGDAIRTKAGITDKLSLDQMANVIECISGGDGDVSEKEVCFYDYDGTLLYSYTLAEAQTLSELPALPEHDGLICQGWNWSLENIKAHKRAVNVGATYVTDDGTTRIYIHLKEGRTSPMLGVFIKGTVTVDWGDGSTPDLLTATDMYRTQWTPNHEYAAPGDYVIRLTVDGEMALGGATGNTSGAYILRYSSSTASLNKVYLNSIKSVEIGKNVTRFGSCSFYNCQSLSSIVIPDSVTTIGSTVFSGCSVLSSIVIPDSVTSIGNEMFYNCQSLSSIVIPDSVTSIDNTAFRGCQSLSSIVIPDGVTMIGNSAIQSCKSLSSIVIPDSVTSIGESAFNVCSSLSSIVIPGSVTSIGKKAFSGCSLLSSVVISDGVTSIGESAFDSCSSLSSIVIPGSITSIGIKAFYNDSLLSSVVISDGVTSIGESMFDSCSSLSSIVIPDSVTSIGVRAFYGCSSLSSIVIPGSVTTIGDYAFGNCYGVRFYDFTKHTSVPTLSSSYNFSSSAPDCEIRVPAALYDEWIAATNWSSFANKIVAV